MDNGTHPKEDWSPILTSRYEHEQDRKKPINAQKEIWDIAHYEGQIMYKCTHTCRRVPSHRKEQLLSDNPTFGC